MQWKSTFSYSISIKLMVVSGIFISIFYSRERFRNISSGAETVEIDEDTIPVIPDIDELQEDFSEDAGVK